MYDLTGDSHKKVLIWEYKEMQHKQESLEIEPNGISGMNHKNEIIDK